MAGGNVLAGSGSKNVVRGSDVVKLGTSDAKPTVLGLGTGTIGGREQRALGTEGFTKLVRHCLDRGVRYIDTADRYMTHIYLRAALKGVPRDKYFIQTKTPARSAEVARADIRRYRRELRTDYLDTVLMHCMTQPDWVEKMRPVLDVLLDEKEKGHIKAVGVSCHGWKSFGPSADCPDLDVHLVRTNPYGIKMDGKPKDVAGEMKKMHDKGRGVIGMKVYGESGLENKKQRFDSLKYVMGLGSVDCFTIGFSKTEQVDETLDLIEQASKELARA